jgi:hypothetical protein
MLRVHMLIDLLVNYFLYCLTCWLDICLLSFALWGDGKMKGKSNYEKCLKIAFCSDPWVSRKRLGPRMTCRTWIHINMYRRKAPMNNLWSRTGDEKDAAGSFMMRWSFRDTEWHCGASNLRWKHAGHSGHIFHIPAISNPFVGSFMATSTLEWKISDFVESIFSYSRC